MRVIERVPSVAPLGLRFADQIDGRSVSAGLRIGVAGGGRVIATPSGTWTVRGVRGLAPVEMGTGLTDADGEVDPAFWTDPPAQAAIELTVEDALGRFVPFTLRRDAPVRVTRVTPTETVGLFCAPTRRLPAGFAAVRAQLFDAVALRPAAGAILEAGVAGEPTARGMADEEGRVVVPLPWPELTTGPAGSPPVPAALASQAWTLELTARYAPGLWPRDLDAALAQPPATLDLPPVPGRTLAYGRELILRTPGKARLHLTPS
jgi:hypothetical protein